MKEEERRQRNQPSKKYKNMRQRGSNTTAAREKDQAKIRKSDLVTQNPKLKLGNSKTYPQRLTAVQKNTTPNRKNASRKTPASKAVAENSFQPNKESFNPSQGRKQNLKKINARPRNIGIADERLRNSRTLHDENLRQHQSTHRRHSNQIKNIHYPKQAVRGRQNQVAVNRVKRQKNLRNLNAKNKTNLPRLILYIIVFILLVCAAYWGYSYMKEKINDYHQAKTVPTQAEKFEPVVCNAQNLDVQLEIKGRAERAGANFNVLFSNPNSIAPCYLDAGNTHLQVVVTSGDAHVWDSRTCQVGAAHKQLLLGKGVSSKQSYAWNGKHTGEQCAGTSLAAAGTYRVSVLLDERKLVENLPFLINANGSISVPAPSSTANTAADAAQ